MSSVFPTGINQSSTSCGWEKAQNLKKIIFLTETHNKITFKKSMLKKIQNHHCTEIEPNDIKNCMDTITKEILKRAAV